MLGKFLVSTYKLQEEYAVKIAIFFGSTNKVVGVRVDDVIVVVAPQSQTLPRT